METRLSRAGAIASLAVCVAAAFAVSTLLPDETPLDGALPLLVAAVSLLALAAGSVRGPVVALAAPLLLAWRLGVPDERFRFLFYGLTLAGAAALVVARALEESGSRRAIPLPLALTVLGAILVPARILPFEPRFLAAQALALAGVVAFAAVVSDHGRLTLEALLVALAIGFVVPLVPSRASLLGFVVATAIWMLRAPTPFTVPAALAATLLAGKWSLPVLAAVGAALVASELAAAAAPRRAPAVAGAAFPLATAALSRSAAAALSWFPETAGSLGGADAAARLAALLLAVGAIVMRPALATVYVVTAVAFVVTVRKPDDGERPFPLVATVFAFAMVALAGYSGAVTSRFPIPGSLAVIVAVAAVAMAGVLTRRLPVIGTALGGFIFLAVVATQTAAPLPHPLRDATPRFALEPGESRETALPEATRAVRLVLSAGNVVDLAPDAPLCTIETIDGGGRIVHRDVTLRDAGDWGWGRRDHFFSSRNEWPERPGGVITGYGHEAFLPGSGLVELDMPDMRVVRISAAASLPARSRLIVESVRAEVSR